MTKYIIGFNEIEDIIVEFDTMKEAETHANTYNTDTNSWNTITKID